VIHTKSNGCRINYSQMTIDDIKVRKALKLLSLGVLLRVITVDAIHFGALQQDIRSNLLRSQGRCRIRGEKWIACSPGEENHSAFFQVANRFGQDKWLGDLLNGKSGLQSCWHSQTFQSILDCQSIDHRRQHSHLITGDTIHAKLSRRESPKEIPTSDDDPNFHSESRSSRNFFTHGPQRCGIYAVLLRSD
jgi:hypothetical protein